ncbi:MAG: formylglycine-generating enzyme family protein [Treponema sp.]|jgi:formylglycine-generating enzyme required for sulfatase activity|nr:formylglycine-generating enzyme family protein [Treponema sp.]
MSREPSRYPAAFRFIKPLAAAAALAGFLFLARCGVDMTGAEIPWQVRISPALTGALYSSHQLAKRGALVRVNLNPGYEGLLNTASVGYADSGGGMAAVLVDSPSGAFVMPPKNIILTLMAKNGGGYAFTTPAAHRSMVPLSGGPITVTSGSGVFISGRSVTLSPFTMAAYETTYQLWKEVYDWAGSHGYSFANPGVEGHGTNGTGAAAEAVRKTRPVTTINWRDAIVWCNAYSEMSGKEPVYYKEDGVTILQVSTNDGGITAADLAVMKPGANGYRLPTEAEWEYAARGGDQITDPTQWGYIYAGTSTALGDYVWYKVNALDVGTGSPDYGAHPVGTRLPNKVTGGLCDMSGNVYEWCWDWNSTIDSSTPITGAASGTIRVVRGGGWYDLATFCTVASRSDYNPFDGDFRIGFRVVCPQ